MSRSRLPPLDSLRVLAACVRHENFSKAAAELRVTATAVSQRMRTLEVQIGVPLFKRHGPRLMATDRAKALAQRLEHALALVSAAVDDCRRIRNPLRVTCAPTFAARWLLPRLTAYHVLPGADAIVLDSAQSLSPPGTFDVAIRSGVGPWPGYESVKLLGESVTPMLNRELLSPTGRMSLRKLLKVPLIPNPHWADWFKIAGLPNAQLQFFATRFPNYELDAQAAAKGMGAALLPPVLYGELATRGQLVAPFPWVLDCRNAYWLLSTAESSQCHFVRWIKSQLGASP